MAGRFDMFVILAEMRTGSNLLEDTLNAVRGLRCHGEVFNPAFIGHERQTTLFGITMAAREAAPLDLLTRMAAQTEGLAGFRFFHNHDPRVLAHVLADRRCAKVILTRNPVDSFVSQQIALQTGQWKLTDARHHRTARVRFDPQAFLTHMDRTQGFQLTVQRALQTTGQTAFNIGYDDLQDADVLTGLIRFLGVDGTATPSRALKKQNPGDLADKVTNFDQMTDALAGYDRFDLWRSPNLEPRRPPMVPAFRAGTRVPLVFMPVKGGPTDAVLAWMAAMEGAGPDALERDFTQKSLRQWMRAHPGFRSFAVVSHPLTRAYRAFCTHIVTGEFTEVRAVVERAYAAALPDLASDGGQDIPDVRQWRDGFLGFLRFIKANLDGQTSARVDASWASQTAVVQGFAQFAAPDMIVREPALAPGLAALCAQIGLAPVPLVGPDAAPAAPVALARVYDAQMEQAARDAYARDYLLFGFGDWSEDADQG